jgi:hypothetical protein
LREQYDNLIDIVNDMEDIKEAEAVPVKSSGFLNEQKKTEFVNKEISFFIDNLRKVSERKEHMQLIIKL